ncbi:MAG: peptide deformylase [Chloroflexi bacterium]|nr:peptide deformylase [Chloroflexota bacterium]
MSIKRIRVYPDPMLRKKCRVVKRIDNKIITLSKDLVDTLVAAGGVGLAANQIGELSRIITLHMPEEVKPIILINPEITRKEGERNVVEGCLSLPGYEGLVKRSVVVSARWIDLNRSRYKVTKEELFAQALEHEIDHLNGILYTDHLLEHEKLKHAGLEQDHPHSHDVDMKITVQKDNDKSKEILESRLNFSKLYSDSSISQMQYELHNEGYFEK